MIFALKEYIDTHLDFLKKSRLLVAVSGGIDSVVLVHLLDRLNFDISLAHVNFNLRGKESDKDVSFVQELGKSLQLPVYVHQVNTRKYADKHKLSIQMAARTIRYDWFNTLIEQHKFDFLLTAHHQDDSIETFFINLLRSSGLDGLTGIPERNGKIIRPLLSFSRKDIVNYAKSQNLSWREDSSNSATKYLRNSLRHKLLPVLNKIAPDYQRSITTSQAYLSNSDELVADYIKLLKKSLIYNNKNSLTIDLDKLLKTPHYKAVLYELLKEFGFTQWNDIYELAKAQSGKQVFSKTHYILKNRNILEIGVINPLTKPKKIEVTDFFTLENRTYYLTIVSREKVPQLNTPDTIYLDAGLLKFPLFVRKWEKGDYFYPLGMQGKKKLSDFLIDKKIGRVDKEKIYLLCDADDSIVWVIDKRIDDRFKITKTTAEILKITSSQNEKNI